MRPRTRLGHVSLEVSNIARARKFYDELFPLLGFREVPINRSMLGYRRQQMAFWITASLKKRTSHLPPRAPISWIPDHLGFWVPSVEVLERLEQELIDKGFKPIYRLDKVPIGFPFSRHPSWYYSNAWSDPDNNVLELYTLIRREKNSPSKRRKKYKL